jgi:hypothetical protein
LVAGQQRTRFTLQPTLQQLLPVIPHWTPQHGPWFMQTKKIHVYQTRARQRVTT